MLLDFPLHFMQFELALLSFVTAFVVAMLCMPFLIKLINRFQFFDVPDLRKMHSQPIPTMGGVAICIGMAIANVFWFRFSNDQFVVAFFLCIAILFALGILDDMHNISVRNKFVIQLAAASLIAFSGVRIESFNGLFGIGELPISAQYTFTVIAIVGITNAFNLIDGIDGLAGGLGFMSLLMVGLFLTIGKDSNIALIAFSLAGGILGFLYYNFNPARIFMGDTGSLVLGFITSVLCIKLLNVKMPAVLPHAPVFIFGVVLIPVFDTLRVFALRIWSGKSPFSPDKIHIHHLLTTNGWSHNFTSKMICAVHGLILVLSYFLKNVSQETGVAILIVSMLLVVFFFKKLKFVHLAPQNTNFSEAVTE
ncbi:MAG: undecaprenyl/decaprenyl-phosphate alpha-N-acetylglucosaminyl 1-phosphate transferase [Flavisolibacter sp.]|nr:undecaprenyl/decaprenyl-phosphate alpha-N-acetylglucosaminyl 1-phosphate transferase [Flavisolibacter sp.]